MGPGECMFTSCYSNGTPARGLSGISCIYCWLNGTSGQHIVQLLIIMLHSKLKRYVETDERQWTTVVLSLVTPIPILLLGFTQAFPSSAVLDLTGEASELPKDFLLSTLLISIFVVSKSVI